MQTKEAINVLIAFALCHLDDDGGSPCSRCGGSHAGETLDRMQKNGIITTEEKKSMKSGSGGQLNPEWVEWLMGFPIEWTDLNV